MSRDDRENRLERISGVYFNQHAKQRIRERVGIQSFNPEKYERRIVDLEGRYYWDRQYENYQVVLEEVMFPFNLNLHEHRPGLLAYVETALPTQEGYREGRDRFQRLYPGKIEAADIVVAEKPENGDRQ